ncbi:hypothetical protein AN639_01460 [Candidatus Epulonipiscium fishelsonii]|uniref:Uncharacterized protein n=1 Tax=Candidatus Epulonipiscium fishelsonii TaxID=77094 RepID=A0ACC8XBM9_9FIRM|nr:hypothetical protein AN639_01460 [Epulopiscium sp. SCG-B05WGA-EpuloA1]ONI40003.1 hypothetical protein AN396_06545 [Epulopiscium sp. SCG-B11WGA-EpuloA1]
MINLFNEKDLSKNIEKMHGAIEANFYVTAGEKCKVIGIQDGTFPDFGHHVRKEMGGVWVHPIKLMDGFWSKINDKWLIANKYQTLPYGNIFYYNEEDLEIERFQFAPDSVKGFVLQYKFKNISDCDKTIEFDTIFRFDISPVWFSEQIGIQDGIDSARFDDDKKIIISKDGLNEWYSVIDCSIELNKNAIELTRAHIGYIETAGKGYSASVSNKIEIKANSNLTLQFYISGSWHNEIEAIEECNKLKQTYQILLEEKIKRYENIKNSFNLTTSDIIFDKQYEWVKYNNDWLIQDSDEFGRAPAAGIPEYPWWFGCDNSYSLQGMLALGYYDLVKQTLKLLHDYSNKINGNGRIVHEITTFGGISNPGNTQETAHYITTVYKYLKWSGDLETVKELYPYCQKGIEWLMEMDDDNDLLPSGYGIIEIQGLNVELIDTAVYTCEALFNMHEISILLENENKDYLEKATRLKEIINTKLWNEEENLYVDAVGKVEEVLKRIPLITAQFERDGNKLDSKYAIYLDKQEQKIGRLDPQQEISFILNKNWVINTPMETKLADKDKAIKALNTMLSEDFVGEYGVYLSGFSNKHIMTISTGVQAVSEGRYKRCDNALSLLEKMMNTMGEVMPGAINEMSPNYGCFVQEWTIYSVMVPIIECFIGIKPNVVNKEIIIDPCIPNKWNRLTMSNMKVGDNIIHFDFSRTAEIETYIISNEGSNIITFINNNYKKVKLNGVVVNKIPKLGVGTFVIEIKE